MNVLLIFVKNPVAGKVKTRLAADIGEQEALEVYIKLLEITKEASSSVNADRRVWYSAAAETDDIWSPEKFSKYKQSGKDLGARMSGAFRHAFADGAKKVVIIGSDCPGITANHIEEAYRLLDEADAVLGPSADGGYYLLGMNHFLPALFHDIDWSTSKVLQQTKAVLNEGGIRYAVLEEMNDIDTAEDLRNDTNLTFEQ